MAKKVKQQGEVKWKCALCGRIMAEKSPHNCVGGFRKRHIIWEKQEVKMNDQKTSVELMGEWIKHYQIEIERLKLKIKSDKEAIKKDEAQIEKLKKRNREIQVDIDLLIQAKISQ